MSIGRRTFSFLTLLFVFSLSATVSVAQEAKGTDSTKVEKPGARHSKDGRRHGFRRGHRRGGLVRGLSKLQLTEPQKSQIETLKMTHKNGQIGFREESRALKMRLRDGTATESEKARMQELRIQQRESVDRLKTSILGILTDDQRLQLQTMGEERKQRMEGHRQRMIERKQRMEQPTKTEG